MSFPGLIDNLAATTSTSDIWMDVFTAALVVVAILQLIAFVWQGRWAKRSVEAAITTTQVMRKTARKELRARVFVLNAKGARKANTFDAELIIKNFGKIPAYRCIYLVAMQLSTNPTPNIAFPVLKATGEEPKFVLPPGGEVKVNRSLPPGTFQDQQENVLLGGGYAIYLHGEIKYRDGFGAQRVSRFRMKCAREDYPLGRFSFCEKGNIAT